ncbi:MAG TPA: Pls/PosA family non-ribosomal peptide synthetase [Baekduia sp.]|uniref:Pls/PosA family non-ribosomal peptide synthetase n=1 Tax=Baekduia sp. TaxID=2600305 RepID=UPI002D782E2E|nr:Pls/PosA family non-ribosomal peptide synthetase [Baekduia sp.]HET6505592.1 Pls/PosA family non-ribosomal peptide synthetase [Baekduia sp.]
MAAHPEAIAVEAADGTFGYRELRDRSAALAAELGAAGIGRGDRVGVRVAGGTARLYVAILGVLRSGAAYVPVDADDPPARAERAWQAAGVRAIVVDDGVVGRGPGSGRGGPPTPADDAWIIFTSGSTGVPKGVAVTHRSAAAFVDAEARLWTVRADDRVLAGLSVGFDASCEEMWLAWRHGATLVPAPRAVVRAGAELGPWLAARRISVVSTVPTLAELWLGDDDDGGDGDGRDVLGGVRLLILGGEALPDALAQRLLADGRREVWNTYGPTEATVVTTAAAVRPGAPVTIGRALDGWATAILDDAGAPVAPGACGELVIAGVGLGRYLDPALDAERFGPVAALGWERAYRTGDLVRDTPQGHAFVGRADDQVKINGRRLELGEVDALLRQVPGVAQAAVVVRRSPAGNAVLVGYAVGDGLDAAAVRTALAERLPAGIVPVVVVLDALPLRSSGKVDRDALPWPPPAAAAPERAAAELGEVEAWVAAAWREQLGPVALTADSDVFALGATSVVVAKLVSHLRRRFPAAAVADVYEHPTLGALAARLERMAPPAPSSDGDDDSRPATPPRRGVWHAAQLAGVVVLLAFGVPVWLESMFFYNLVTGNGPRIPWPVLVVAWLLLLSPPGGALLLIVTRRLLLADLRPGRHERHGWLAYRIWFVERLARVLHVERLAGTPWAPRVARALGADVAPDARLGTLPAATSLMTVGAGATIEASVETHGWSIEGDALVLGAVTVGPGASVGARSVLMPGAVVGAHAEIEPGSVITGTVPPGERWGGSPAAYLGEAGATWPAQAPPAPRRGHWSALYGLGLAATNMLSLIAALPPLTLLAFLGAWTTSSTSATVVIILASAPLLAAMFIVTEAVVTALAFRAASRLLRPGLHADTGAVGWALWFTGAIVETTLKPLFPLYASIYTRPWLRLHGIAVGRRTEISTTEGLNPLVELGATSFMADHPFFAVGRARAGWLRVEPIQVGDRAFIGNGAVLPGGARVGHGSLVGIESNAPADMPDGSSWFGNPPLELPRIPEAADPRRTTNPPRRLVVARGAVEVVRILLPTSVSIALGSLIFLGLNGAGDRAGVVGMLAAALPLEVLGAVAATVVTVVVKWAIIGRYRAGERPLWSSFVWRDEIVNSCQEQLAGEWLLETAQGTAIVPAYLRAMGARVGRDVWVDSLAITEFDVVTLHDGCAVNRGACVETHLFHDRVLRIGPAELGPGSSLGTVSAVLPDCRLGAETVVGGRSVVLRGEVLPPRTRWHGAPVVGVAALPAG